MLGWLLALLALAPTPASLPERTFVPWPHDTPDARVRAAGLTLVNISAPCDVTRRDIDPGHCWIAGVRIERTGAPSIELHGVEAILAKLAVGATTRGAPPTVILSSFTGGAHCCEQYEVAIPDGHGWRVTRIAWTRPEWQGAASRTQTQFDGGLREFPRDIDGDGVPDFVLTDDRFDYTFASYAGSASPPVVLNWRDGRWTDVSMRRRFAHLFEVDLVKWRTDCMKRGEYEHNGVCAAYAADAARLGRIAEAWPVVHASANQLGSEVDWGVKRCPVTFVARHCPPEREITYPDYFAALRAFLGVTGYLAVAAR